MYSAGRLHTYIYNIYIYRKLPIEFTRRAHSARQLKVVLTLLWLFQLLQLTKEYLSDKIRAMSNLGSENPPPTSDLRNSTHDNSGMSVVLHVSVSLIEKQ